MTAGLVPAVQAARPQPPDADFDALRAAAMATVQSEEAPAPAGWTDHNLHDPGITLLEAALFAVADLHYRTAERRFDAWPFELRGWRGLVPPATTADREDAAAFFAVAANVTAARAIVARASSRTRALLDLASA
ncbi:MAG: hypothetical protein ACXVZ4_07355, partial [Gaiellaceae bacterium]